MRPWTGKQWNKSSINQDLLWSPGRGRIALKQTLSTASEGTRVKWQKFFPNNKQVLLYILPCIFIVILECSINLGPTGPRHSLTMIHLTSLLSFYTDMPLIFHFRFSASWRMLASILLGKDDVLTFSSAISCTAGNRPQWKSLLLFLLSMSSCTELWIPASSIRVVVCVSI